MMRGIHQTLDPNVWNLNPDGGTLEFARSNKFARLGSCGGASKYEDRRADGFMGVPSICRESAPFSKKVDLASKPKSVLVRDLSAPGSDREAPDHRLSRGRVTPAPSFHRRWHLLGIHYRGVQWEGGAVDGGSFI